MRYIVETYIAYGACFFLLGVVALLQKLDSESVPISRQFYLLGAFGLLHGSREFVDAWMLATRADAQAVRWFAAMLLAVSYLPLFEFGRRAALEYARTASAPWRPLFSLWVYVPILLGVAFFFAASSGHSASVEAGVRYLLAFPGSVLTGLALRRAFPTRNTAAGALAAAFVIYGVSGGLITGSVPGFPAWFPTYETFFEAAGFPIQLVRATCALVAVLSLSFLIRNETRMTLARMRDSASRNRELAASLEQRVEERTAALRESERRLQTAMKNTHLGYYIWDLIEDRCVFCTEEYAAIHGMSVDDYMSAVTTLDEDSQLVHPEDRDRYEQAIKRLQEESKPLDLEYRIVGKDGRVRHVRELESITEMRDGVAVKTEGTLQDITELKLIEQELRVSEATYRGILENMADTYYRTDADGRISMISPSAVGLLGYSLDDLIGRKLPELYVRPADRDSFLRTLEDQGGQIRGYVAPLRRKNGQTVLIETSSRFLRDANGVVIGVEGTARDVTARMRAEEMNTRLGRIVEDSVNEIYVFDSESLRFIQVNRGARENLGYTMAELGKMTPVDVKPEFTKESFCRLIEPLLNGSLDVLEFETVHARKDGSTYSVDVRLQLSLSETPPVFFAVILDTTERKQTEERLVQAQKMEAVGQLTGGIAHDFNNLLAIILGNLELVLENLSAGDKNRDQIGMAIKASERGASLTQRLLAFSRKQALRPVPVNAKKLIDDMLVLIRRSLGETIEIEVVADAGLWATEVDPSQLENSLLNLALNARDAMPDGGKLTIEASNARLTDEYAAGQIDVTPGQYVLISVSDTGHGMTRKVRERVFDPFFTTKDAGRGTGLGLSMVQGFVKQSGGHVAIYSEVGKGTTIKLYLPRYKGSKAIVEWRKQLDGSEAGRGEVVLVVEDDPDLRAMTAKMLQSLGYDTLEASTAAEALEFKEQDIELKLLLTDLVLPGGMSGRDLANKIVEKDPKLPILFMSGYTENTVIHHGRLDEGVRMLEKPFRIADLSRAVRKAIDRQAD